MNNQFLTIAIFFIISSSFCQSINLVNKFEEYEPYTKPNEFHYLNDKLDSLKSMKIAIIEGSFNNSRKSNLVSLFQRFKDFSNNYGANSFRVNMIDINEYNDSSYIQLTIYSTSQTYLNENRDLYPSNKVFIIGNLDYSSEDTKKITINKIPVYIRSFEYIEYQNTVGEKLRINRGGMLGMTIKITGKVKRSPAFYSIGGVSVMPSSNVINPSVVGVSLSTGKFNIVDENLGFFLINILKNSDYSNKKL